MSFRLRQRVTGYRHVSFVRMKKKKRKKRCILLDVRRCSHYEGTCGSLIVVSDNMDGDYSLKNALCSKLHPRLSSSLRAHGGVSKVSHIEHDRIEIDTQALQLKKQAQLASLSTQRSWYNLKEAIVLSCCPSDRKKVKPYSNLRWPFSQPLF